MLFGICTVCNGELGFGPEVRVDSHYPEPLTGDVDVIRLLSGRFVVVWEGANYHYEDMKVICSYSDDFGSTWSNHIQVGDGNEVIPGFSRLAKDSAGTLYCVWDDWRGPETYAIYFSRSDDGGETWLWPNVRVSNAGQTGLEPGIASNGDGSVLVSVFTRFSEMRTYSSFSTDGGYSWSSDTPVGDYTIGYQIYPVVEWVGGDMFVALWRDKRDTESLVYCSVSEDNGQTWLQPNLPVPCGGNRDLVYSSIRLHWDGSVLHATWIEEVDNYIENVYYSRSEDNGYTWLDEPVQVNYDTPNTLRRYGGIWARNPAEIFIAWDTIWNQSRPTYAVCAFSTDSGQTWSDTLRANPVSGESDWCDLYGDVDSGEILLAWSNQVNGHVKCSHGSDLTGIEPHYADTGITMSRNPFTGTVSIQVTGDNPPETLTLYDSCGRVVKTLETSIQGSFAWTPTENASPGVYFVLGSVGDRAVHAKVLLLDD